MGEAGAVCSAGCKVVRAHPPDTLELPVSTTRHWQVRPHFTETPDPSSGSTRTRSPQGKLPRLASSLNPPCWAGLGKSLNFSGPQPPHL